MIHALETKEAVLSLVKGGKSYSQIQKEYGVPKSTISTWVKNEGVVHDRTKQLEHLKRARNKSIETIKAQKAERQNIFTERAKYTLNAVPIEDMSVQKSLLAMLYWAEGSKGENASLKFVNTDPLLIKLYVCLLRSCYQIEESRLRVRVHIGYWHNPKQVFTFWSELLNIPGSQFGKIYVKKRSTQKKFRKNYRGICFISYGSKAIQQELLILGRLLAEKALLSSFNG